MSFLRLSFCALSTAVLLSSGCKSVGQNSSSRLRDADQLATSDIPKGQKNLCVGVHGNGNLIMAHFGAYARIVEHYGLIDGFSGGSSGSISLFLYESIYMNKALRKCAQGACSKIEEGQRAGLLLKSLQGYLQFIDANTSEAAAIKGLLPIYKKAKAQGMDSLLITDKLQARALLIQLLQSKDIKDIVNDEVITLLQTSPNKDYHTKAIYEGLANTTEWKTDDPIILIRPGVINFEGLTRKIGRIANFYAGYGPADEDGMKEFLNSCATPANRGKSWNEIAGTKESPTVCGQKFDELLKIYRSKLLANESAYPSRINDDVGAFIPALISTSLLEGQRAADRFKASRTNFLQGKPIDWQMDFSDVRFGYWGSQNELALAAANPKNYHDKKTSRFLSLGTKKWAEALKYSPAEPGLARAQEMTDTRVSAGGWSDLHPTLVLNNMGCKDTIYVTRRADSSTFAVGVAQLLGADAQEEKELYDMDMNTPGQESAIALSVKEANAVWCTNWNDSKTEDIAGTVGEAYSAPVEVRGNTPVALIPYNEAKPKVDYRGCTPGSTNLN